MFPEYKHRVLACILFAVPEGTTRKTEAPASGIYSYTLFTDGKPVETRRMIKR